MAMAMDIYNVYICTLDWNGPDNYWQVNRG